MGSNINTLPLLPHVVHTQLSLSKLMTQQNLHSSEASRQQQQPAAGSASSRGAAQPAAGAGPQIVCMSATMGGLDTMCKWLNARLFMTNFRPVKLQVTIRLNKRDSPSHFPGPTCIPFLLPTAHVIIAWDVDG